MDKCKGELTILSVRLVRRVVLIRVPRVVCSRLSICRKIETKRGLRASERGLVYPMWPVRSLGLRRGNRSSLMLELQVAFALSLSLQNLAIINMSSTGGGWAQLRQQARALETQVRSAVPHQSSRYQPLTRDADRDPVPHILAVCLYNEYTHEAVRRGAKMRVTTPRDSRKGSPTLYHRFLPLPAASWQSCWRMLWISLRWEHMSYFSQAQWLTGSLWSHSC